MIRVDVVNKLIFAVALIRLLMLIVFGFYYDTYLNQAKIYNDAFHHYQLGILLLLVSLVSNKIKNISNLYLIIGLALIIEEYSVILYQLGIPHFHYLSIMENILIIVFLFVSWCIFNLQTGYKIKA